MHTKTPPPVPPRRTKVGAPSIDGPKNEPPKTDGPKPKGGTRIPKLDTKTRNRSTEEKRKSFEQLQKSTGEEVIGTPSLDSGGTSLTTSPEMLRVQNRSRPLPTPPKRTEITVTDERMEAPRGLPRPPNCEGRSGLETRELNFEHRQGVIQHFSRLVGDRTGGRIDERPIPEGLLHAVANELIVGGGEKQLGTSIADPEYGAKMSRYLETFDRLLTANGEPGQKLWGAIEESLRVGVARREEHREQLTDWKGKHGVVWPIKMNQSDHLPRETDFRLENGICQAASYEWIRELQDNPTLLTQVTSAGKITDRVRLVQREHVGDDGPEGYQQRMMNGLIPKSRTDQDGVRERMEAPVGAPSETFTAWLSDAIKRGKLEESGGTFILNLVHPEHENHAIGFQVTPEPKGGYSLRMYDVNEGCFELNHRRFESLDPEGSKKGKKTKKDAPPKAPGIEGALNDYLGRFYGDYSGFSILTYPKT